MAGSARLSKDHSGRTELKIQINPRLDAFLLDHVVAGAPLLPTVMQLDLAARALPACCAQREAPAMPEGILLWDVVVGSAVRFDRPGPRELHLVSRRRAPVRAGPEAFSCELLSPGEPGAHLTVVAERTTTPVPLARSPGAWACRLPCGPDLVYPPFFHGATFAVVGRFGRSAAGLTARLARAGTRSSAVRSRPRRSRRSEVRWPVQELDEVALRVRDKRHPHPRFR